MKDLIKIKIKIAKRAVMLLKIVPNIRFIALSGSVANCSATEKSDIDLFIIAKNNYIFSTRYLCVFLLTIFNLKSIPSENKIANKICLSLFLNENNLNMDRLESNTKEEKLRAKWIYDIVPMYDEKNKYLEFVDKNSWVKKYYRDYYTHMSCKSKNITYDYFLYLIKKIFEIIMFFGIGYIFEKIVRHIQVQRLFNFKHQHLGYEKMIINDQIIKLHCCKKNGHKELF